MIRAELHAHTADDPSDRVPFTAQDLIVRAGELGYGAIAITLHDAAFDPAPLARVRAASTASASCPASSARSSGRTSC